MTYEVKDSEGRTIKVGDVVEHTLAKHVRHWAKPRTMNGWEMEDGYELTSIPFPGTRTVERIATSTCVQVKQLDRYEVPVFLGHFLRVT